MTDKVKTINYSLHGMTYVDDTKNDFKRFLNKLADVVSIDKCCKKMSLNRKLIALKILE